METLQTLRIKHPKSDNGQKIVIVVGGGFGGLALAKSLANEPEVQVVLVDQRNHHLFQPLLYQVATGGLNAADIAVPIRAQFSHVDNVAIHMGKVDAVNLSEKYIVAGRFEFLYDYLVLACGASHTYFAHPEWEDVAPGLKTLEQAIEIRRRVFSAFELAENEVDPQLQQALLTFVVVGGGPTGVELAGAISDIARTVLVSDFKRINPASARVLLVEAGPRILGSFAEDLGETAKRDLEKLGVEVLTSSKVEKITGKCVQIGNQEIATHRVFWAAGVQATKMPFTPPVAVDRAQRVIVNKDFTIPQFPEVFVIGDMASLELSPGQILPGLAPAAMQAGQYVANTILRRLRGKAVHNFKYRDKGQMATIGKRKAVAQAGKMKLTGFIAWLAWLFIHVLYLVGFKNRLFVLSQWGWSYLFSKRGARLITDPDWHLVPRVDPLK
jgi:NADH dehydrogenase